MSILYLSLSTLADDVIKILKSQLPIKDHFKTHYLQLADDLENSGSGMQSTNMSS